MPSLLKMPGLNVTPDYIDAFFRANNSFLYQLVYDPVHRKLVPLNPYPDDIIPAELHYAGPYPLSCLVEDGLSSLVIIALVEDVSTSILANVQFNSEIV